MDGSVIAQLRVELILLGHFAIVVYKFSSFAVSEVEVRGVTTSRTLKYLCDTLQY